MPARQGDAYVVIDPAKLAEFMRSPSGPVLRDLIEKGERVKEEAKRLVGVSQPDPVPRRNPRRPGTLRDSIVKRVVDIGGQPAVIIVAEDKIAFWHHEGTVPHPIDSREGGPDLVFYWPKIGKVVRTRHVNHPGTQPNRFLVNALRVIANGT